MVMVAGPNTPQLQQTAADLPEIGDVTSDVQSLDSDSQHQPVPVKSTPDPLPKKRKLSDGKSISTKNADSSCKPEEVGKDLLEVFLRKNLDFTKVRDKVLEILQSSSNPAITVLNTMKLCRPTKPIKEEVSISWCISLLKELKGVSYTIGHSTIEEAREFSLSWKENIKEKKGDHTEIACFLLFVDAYQLGLTRATVSLIESVHCTKQLRGFFEQIGMPDFLPDLIKSLIGTNNRIQAVRYIEALNLRDKFPIVPILNAHLAYSNQFTDEKYFKDPNLSDCRKMSAINRRLNAVKSVIELVKQCKLEVVYPLRPLEEKLGELIRLQNSEGERQQQLINREEEASATATVTTTTTASSKPPPPSPPLYCSSVSSSCNPPKRAHQGAEQLLNRTNYGTPAPLHLVRPPQPFPWFHPPHPNQFGPQIGHGGWSYFPSNPSPGFM